MIYNLNLTVKAVIRLTVGAANHLPKLSWYPTVMQQTEKSHHGRLAAIAAEDRLACRETDSGGDPSGTFSSSAAQGVRWAGPADDTGSLNGDEPPALSDLDLETTGREQSCRGGVSLSRYCLIRNEVAVATAAKADSESYVSSALM